MSELNLARLKSRISKRQVLIIAGAGVAAFTSKTKEASSWRSLVDSGLQRLVELGYKKHSWLSLQSKLLYSGDTYDLIGVAEQVSMRLGWQPEGNCHGEWNEWLRDTVGAADIHDDRLIRALAQLRCPIATTNYDSLLSRVIGVSPIPWSDCERWLPVLEDHKNAAILHLHGYWERPETVVLGASSYSAIYHHILARELQKALAATKSLLFVGCGATLEDPNFSRLLNWIATHLNSAEHSHYFLTRDKQPLPLNIDSMRRARIQTISYGKEYNDILRFIELLAPTDTAAAGFDVGDYNDAHAVPEGFFTVKFSLSVSNAISDKDKALDLVQSTNRMLQSLDPQHIRIDDNGLSKGDDAYSFWRSVFKEAECHGCRTSAAILIGILPLVNADLYAIIKKMLSSLYKLGANS